jgi:hypothetical protein
MGYRAGVGMVTKRKISTPAGNLSTVVYSVGTRRLVVTKLSHSH